MFLFSLNESLARAISFTLIHSLWQGMLLAIIAGVILWLTRRSAPACRYNLLTAALCFFVVGISVTLVAQLKQASPELTFASDLSVNALSPGTNAQVVKSQGENASLFVAAREYFIDYASWIVLTWLLVIVMKSLQLSAGFYRIRQLRTNGTAAPGTYWDERISILCSRLHLNINVRLLQSSIATVPAVIGFFKPIILFPAGMLTALPPEAVEAILLHELAHIRRRDYLVNVLQHFVEIIFFFNPAVKWVSSLIRIERENCCDDIAVGQTNNKRSYINALLSFHREDPSFAPTFGHAFAGEQQHLLSRVKRIIYNNNKTLNNMEKKLLGAGLLITSLLIFAFTSNGLQQKLPGVDGMLTEPGKIVMEAVHPDTDQLIDTFPGRPDSKTKKLNGTINTRVHGKNYRIITDNDEVTDLYIDGKKIPAENIGEHKEITGKILAESKRDIAVSEKDMENAQNELAEAQQQMEQAQQDILAAHEEIEKSHRQMELDMENATAELTLSGKDMELSKKELAAAKIEIEKAKTKMKSDIAGTKNQLEQARKEIAQSKIDIAQSRKELEQSKKEMAESKKIQESVVADFVKENLVKDKSELSSYKLTNEELIINGVKQPDSVHKKFKEKYVKSNNWSMSYND